ncbi:cytochrome c2 [Mycoplana dimorpha]|uniref:Cytochrome c2 n=2 Tax=Mycoplana dimorpha TaxID=28320 RepID=A0A2T5BEN2_MYCDI|nr:c-type cytochrome [Mycoplana dimorpha]PTM97323.1 cytochrome c2 [Mycoplana dimorpha]
MPTVSAWYRIAGVVLIGVASMLVAVIVYSAKERSKHQAMAMAMTGGDPALAPPIFRRYGCGGCHTIPGIPGADGKVGPPLQGLSQRVYIGGVANNSAENLVAWIVMPQQFSPNCAMPATGVSAAEARHLAAYLYAH